MGEPEITPMILASIFSLKYRTRRLTTSECSSLRQRNEETPVTVDGISEQEAVSYAWYDTAKCWLEVCEQRGRRRLMPSAGTVCARVHTVIDRRGSKEHVTGKAFQ